MLNYQEIIETIASDLKGVKDKGTVASYIPELSKIDPKKFGIHLVDAHMNRFSAGDAEELFSIQSISKVAKSGKMFCIGR